MSIFYVLGIACLTIYLEMCVFFGFLSRYGVVKILPGDKEGRRRGKKCIVFAWNKLMCNSLPSLFETREHRLLYDFHLDHFYNCSRKIRKCFISA